MSSSPRPPSLPMTGSISGTSPRPATPTHCCWRQAKRIPSITRQLPAWITWWKVISRLREPSPSRTLETFRTASPGWLIPWACRLPVTWACPSPFLPGSPSPALILQPCPPRRTAPTLPPSMPGTRLRVWKLCLAAPALGMPLALPPVKLTNVSM